jgi:hypothetical protein
MNLRERVAAVLVVVGLSCSGVARAQIPTFQSGDVFQSVGAGVVYVYRFNPANGLYEPVSALFSPGFESFRTTGSAFDKDGNFYVTLFNNDVASGPISRFQRDFDALSGHLPVQIGTYGNSPESVVFDAAGNMYVGHKNKGTPAVPCVPPPPGVFPRGDVITKIAPNGACLAAFDVVREGARRPTVPPPRPDDLSNPDGDVADPQGADWIDLASDQRTLYYTSLGRRIMRFDTVANAQLPDFASLSSHDAAQAQEGQGQLFAFRLLADGSVLAADNVNVKHIAPGGAVVQTYDLGPAQGFQEHDNWFSLNLDPDGLSFWSGDGRNGMIHRFRIEDGQVLASIDTGFADTFFGVAVFQELTQGTIPRCDDTLLVMSTVTGATCGTLTWSATLTCGGQPVAGRSIAFHLGGVDVGHAITDAAGIASVSEIASPSQPGTVAGGVTASFAGDPQYAGTAASADLILTDSSTIVLSPVSGATCGTLTMSATLMCGTRPVQGRTIAFSLNGNAVGHGTTDAAGLATISGVSSPAQPGTVVNGASAQFAGDAQYPARTAFADLALTDGCPPPPQISCQVFTLAIDNEVANSCSTFSICSTLVCDGKPVAGRVLKFTVAGADIGEAMTNEDGFAKIEGIQVPQIDGRLDLAVIGTFAGDADYASTFGSASITINPSLARIDLETAQSTAKPCSICTPEPPAPPPTKPKGHRPARGHGKGT